MVIKYAGIPVAKSMAELSDEELRAAAAAAMDFTLPVKGTEGFDQAQVTHGGMDTAEFDPNTLESRLVQGSSPAVRCWTWTVIAAAITSNGPGPAGFSQGGLENDFCT